jgi:porphyrinogen peroxidase
MSAPSANEPAPAPQPVLAPLTSSAIFLVATIKPDQQSYSTVRDLVADLPGIYRAVDFRRIEGGLSCVASFGSDAWDKLFPNNPRPAELHPFKELRAGDRHAPSTPADLLFHLRAKRMDLCFELVAQIMSRIGPALSTVDETHGFRYFDDRDLLGFVDGTENPRGLAALNAALITEAEDPHHAAGSYVIIQKYLHDMSKWNSLTTEEQERVIGRAKLSDIEMSDAVKPKNAHSALTSIDENGKELQILRDNMPFGKPGQGEFGTYFIGYCHTPRVTEQMLENMFIGKPPGNYDRILDFSRAVSGSLFFAPSATFLDSLGD